MTKRFERVLSDDHIVDSDKMVFDPDAALTLAERMLSVEITELLADELIQFARKLHERYAQTDHIPDIGKNDRQLARLQPCGCVICYCENQERCLGCGAKYCGTHDVGEIPNPVYVDHIADASKMVECAKCCNPAIHHLIMDNLGYPNKTPLCSDCTQEHEHLAQDTNNHEIRNFGGAYGLVAFHYEPLGTAQPDHIPDDSKMAAQALRSLTKELQADAEYAWSWHCNMAMPIMDSTGVSRCVANIAAARLMQHLFGIDTEKHPNFVVDHIPDIGQMITPLAQRKIQTLLDKGEYRLIENASVLVNDRGHAAIVNHGGAFYWVDNEALAREFDGAGVGADSDHIADMRKMVDDADEALRKELDLVGLDMGAYSSPKEALVVLIDWHVSVATDPRANGGWQLVPVEPDQALLVSMATCLNHGFGLLTKEKQDGQLYDMRKLYDEVVGKGYYSPKTRERYLAMLAAAPKCTGEK